MLTPKEKEILDEIKGAIESFENTGNYLFLNVLAGFIHELWIIKNETQYS